MVLRHKKQFCFLCAFGFERNAPESEMPAASSNGAAETPSAPSAKYQPDTTQANINKLFNVKAAAATEMPA